MPDCVCQCPKTTENLGSGPGTIQSEPDFSLTGSFSEVLDNFKLIYVIMNNATKGIMWQA